MALIKCPECKKKISDTVDKCPHCGIDLSNVSKENLKVKEFKFKKKYIVIGVILVVILIVLFSVNKMLYPADGNVNKAVRFLKSEGYECEKTSNPFITSRRGEYVCEDEDSNDNRKVFTIWWKGGVYNFVSNLIHSEELFDSTIHIDFIFYNSEDDYVSISPAALEESYAFVMQDEDTSEWLCTFWPEGGSEDDPVALGNKDVETHYDDCNDGYRKYVDDINDSLDDIRDLLEELDMD